MIFGVGIDVLDVGRLEQALARRPRLMNRLFSADELEYANGHRRPSIHLAARFCAKEAVAKALALEGWSFTDVEVQSTVPPQVSLQGRAKARAEELNASLVISLTHTSESAAAMAVSYRGR